MNALSFMILGAIAHATGFAVIGSLVYLALRRWSPAAGSLAAGSSLAVMALVSLIALGPWPRWWVLDPGRATSTTKADSRVVKQLDETVRFQAEERATQLTNAGETSIASPANSRIERFASGSWLGPFLSELSRELRRPATERARARWGWTEWIAVGVLASLGFGLARLALGIWSIQQLKARSRPIGDRDLNGALEVIQAELSCSRKVEPRESTDLASPATIGWRRPLLLLPLDWPLWSAAERRAVLAHEVAHVCRGDFAACLVAQVGLALHFYHPLAHWLAARLRLEQELAADAWGAFLSGGKQPYLATLAQMALRRDGRALTWPARAFLPSRGTFVRRIEMLRSSKQIRHQSLSTASRLLTVGILTALGLLVAGLRGPVAWDTAPALAQPPGPAAGPARVAGNESYNLAFLPADAKMVLAVRPAALLKRREFRALMDQINQITSLKAIQAVRIEDVDQLVAFWEGNPPAPVEPSRSPMVPLPSGFILRMTKPQEWKPILNQLMGSPQEVRHDGQTYLSSIAPGAQRWGAFSPDDRALVIAHEDLLRELIEDRNAPAPRHPWDQAWQKVVKGQLMLALETRWVRRRLAQGVPGGPQAPGQSPAGDLKLDTISPLLDKAQSYALAIDTSNGLVVDLVAAAGSENDAKPVADTMQALLTLARNAVQGLRPTSADQPVTASEAKMWAFQAADSLLAKARIETSASFVRLQAKSSLDLAEGIKLLAPAVSAAQNASRRKQSVNNLKQIALALYNYQSADGHFPSPVLLGGSNKSIPYSWRVAILPYLEQNELYKQYNFEEPWDGPNNRKLLDKMPALYSYPGLDGRASNPTNASYFVFTGPGAAMGEAAKPTSIADINDGTSNTIMVVEAKRDIPWTKPEDLPFDPKGPLPELGGFNPNSFNVAFVDGSVRTISNTMNRTVLKTLITRAGGEVVRLEDGPDPQPKATPAKP